MPIEPGGMRRWSPLPCTSYNRFQLPKLEDLLMLLGIALFNRGYALLNMMIWPADV